MAFLAAPGGSGGGRALRPLLLQQLQRGSTARAAVMGARRPIVTWPKQQPSGQQQVSRLLLQGRPSSSPASAPAHPSRWWQPQQQGGSRHGFSSSSSGGSGGSGAGRAQSAREAQAAALAERNKRLGLYFFSIVVAVTGVCYASVPLYKVFCQATGFGGTTKRVESLEDAVGSAPPEKVRPLKIVFNADVSDTTPWKFWPTQPDILVIPGETSLAFYTVKNKTDKAILGVATYNVHPPKAGLYFNKIQCFCFDEQRLKPREEIDMPVFFFIDPEILNDPSMDHVHEITLSYTFFKTDEDNQEEIQKILEQNRTKDGGPAHAPVGKLAAA